MNLHSDADVENAVIELRKMSQSFRGNGCIGMIMTLEEQIIALKETVEARNDLIRRFVDAHDNSARPSTRALLLDEARALISDSLDAVEQGVEASRALRF